MENNQILWNPSNKFIDNSNLKHYEKWLLKNKDLVFENYSDLWQWSVDNYQDFWESLWEYFEIKSYSDYKSVCSENNIPGSTWFEGARLNYAEHIFRMYSNERDALVFINEQRCQKMSWSDLKSKVKAFQSYLLEKGIKEGDCVAAFLPNIPEAIIAFLAVNSIGAVWSCCSPDFGVKTVLERFEQIKPKIFIAVDGYRYNSKAFNRLDEVNQIEGKLTDLVETVLIKYLDDESESTQAFVDWNDIMNASFSDTNLSFKAVDFNHPIWVLYSSGTTGKPKAITHSHGGVLLEHLKYMTFHNDTKKGENFFWFTTTGWMMWNFLQASMLVGATPVLFDGSPAIPDLELLWQIAQDLPIHHFGTSAPYLTACMKKDLKISEKYNMSSLRSIGSTGAPLPPEVFEWIYSNISEDVWLCSMSGGTDVCTAFVGGNPYNPVQKGRIQSRALGCSLYAYDEDGNRVEGSLGEMVIEKPMPSMPIYFWNDPGKERYSQSYYEKFPEKWCHGDWIKLFDDGSLIIQGRSDATLNRKGIRIGTAEIYSVVDKIDGLKDSVILNLEKESGEDIMPLFVVLKEGYSLDDKLEKEIKIQLRQQCSPRHVPDLIFKVDDIPYTLSGKKMEIPLKKLFMGLDMKKMMNKDAMRNPDSLHAFIAIKNNLSD